MLYPITATPNWLISSCDAPCHITTYIYCILCNTSDCSCTTWNVINLCKLDLNHPTSGAAVAFLEGAWQTYLGINSCWRWQQNSWMWGPWGWESLWLLGWRGQQPGGMSRWWCGVYSLWNGLNTMILSEDWTQTDPEINLHWLDPIHNLVYSSEPATAPDNPN